MKALYRKYRPVKLADVVGESQVTTALENSLKSGKISHAYLFIGPRGCGKTSVARIFAHEVNGFEYEVEDSYTDIIEIDAASNTGVDNIRELKERAVIAPTEGKYKVYIIDEVHMLSKPAFNALLKILEEPPKHVIFIMATTDVYKVLPTIISRSQVYNFKLADEEIMLPFLKKMVKTEKIDIDDDALKIIIRRGGGSFRDTISLLDQISGLKPSGKIVAEDVISVLGLPKDQAIDELLSSYESGNLAEVAERLRNILNNGARAETVAEEIIDRILKNPQPTRIALLKTLPEVSAPFAEAKLLLALTSNFAVSPASARGDAVRGPAGPEPKASGTDGRYNTAGPVTSTEFDWFTYLTSVISAIPSLKNRLESCKYIIAENTLKLYPEKKIYATILKSANNLTTLKKHLPINMGIEICDPEDTPKTAETIPKTAETEKSPSKNSELSDIMGVGIEEVKDVGDDPF